MYIYIHTHLQDLIHPGHVLRRVKTTDLCATEDIGAWFKSHQSLDYLCLDFALHALRVCVGVCVCVCVFV